MNLKVKCLHFVGKQLSENYLSLGTSSFTCVHMKTNHCKMLYKWYVGFIMFYEILSWLWQLHFGGLDFHCINCIFESAIYSCVHIPCEQSRHSSIQTFRLLTRFVFLWLEDSTRVDGCPCHICFICRYRSVLTALGPPDSSQILNS